VPGVKRNEFLAAVRAEPDHHHQAHVALIRPGLEVDSIVVTMVSKIMPISRLGLARKNLLRLHT
jgi:hypothetical protein